VVAIFGRSAFFPFLMLFLLSDNFGRRAAEERSHAEHGNELNLHNLTDRNSLVSNEIRDYIVSCGVGDQTANFATFVALRAMLAEES